MKVCYPLMQPCLAVPWGQKKPQHVHFSTSRRSNVGAPMSQLTDKSRVSSDDNIKPWFKLLGMTLSDLDDGFPETLWDAVGADSPETLKKKDRQNRHLIWSKDTDVDPRFAESIVFDKTLYKYAILGCRASADTIVKKGMISASQRDEIVLSLARIEDDIELGMFQWVDGADVHTNIVQALADKLGDLPKDLAVDSIYDSCVMILDMWCKNHIEHIMTKIKRLQVALVLLALRNDGLVLPGNREDRTLIGSLVLPILKALDKDVSGLRHTFGRLYLCDAFILHRNSDICSYPEIDTTTKRYTIAYYARTISYDIPNDIAQFLEKFVPLKDLLSFKPHKDATHGTILEKLLPDGPKRGRGHSALSKCLNIAYRRDHGLLQDCEIEDAKSYIFSSVEAVLQMLSVSIKFAEKMSFDLVKMQTRLPSGYGDVVEFAHVLTSKGIALETAYVLVHICLEKRLQPSELTLDELQRIGFPCEHVHDLLQDKGSVFRDFSCRDMSKEMIKWCCKLRISPETISS
ncbi:argininosuccinate lyase, chloroplastic-like [Lolium perenne]|uniref:argininosuccinate lyase, chloroplastic-like n=1 Tax=Lolium perenne TaxID=4522 RepID=UPI0021F5C5EC|nr:argininosuccinate lyase, chloroplastic-like [Lolium perenne]